MSDETLVARPSRDRLFNRLLLLASGLLIGALIFLSVSLWGAYQKLQNSVREDAIWAVFQLDREIRQVAMTLNSLPKSALSGPDLDRLKLRYEILYSRMSVLRNAKYGEIFVHSESFAKNSRRIDQSISAIDADFMALLNQDRVWPADLLKFIPFFETASRYGSELLSQANSLISEQRADERSQILSLQRSLLLASLLLIATMFVLIFKLSRDAARDREEVQRMVRLRDDIAKSWKAAEAGNRARSQFMATIGHEIRTPLNAIIGMAELIDENQFSGDDLEAIKVIRVSGHALHEMINEILDYSKIEAGKIEIHPAPVAIGSMVEDTIAIMRGRAQEKGISLTSKISPDLWDTAYEADPVRLKQVLVNLIGNAVKFTDQGKVSVKCALEENGSSTNLQFEVVDTGIGIDDDGYHKLFQPFSQVDDSINRKYGGTGLGLMICKEIVNRLGGEIGVESVPGQGSRFWFNIPTRMLGPIELPRMKHDPGPDWVDTSLSLLLVEDNEVNRLVALKMLNKLGHTADVATNGQEAIEACSRKAYDLILMDVQMPVLDGIEATRRILANCENKLAPVVYALTANASDEDRTTCFDVGMRGFMAKPISLHALRIVIATIAKESQSRSPQMTQSPAGRPSAVSLPSATTGSEPGQLTPSEALRQEELLAIFDEEDYAEVLDSYFRDVAKLLANFARLKPLDFDERYQVLHAIKGISLNVGFDSIAEISNCADYDTPNEQLLNHLCTRVEMVRRATQTAFFSRQ